MATKSLFLVHTLHKVTNVVDHFSINVCFLPSDIHIKFSYYHVVNMEALSAKSSIFEVFLLPELSDTVSFSHDTTVT